MIVSSEEALLRGMMLSYECNGRMLYLTLLFMTSSDAAWLQGGRKAHPSTLLPACVVASVEFV